MKYGLPYKGSKNKLAERIVRLLPKRTHLVDLFCGGCAVSHAALLMGKYEHIHINWMCPTLFIDALNGKYNDENRWISREDFFRLKDTDPYVAVVWSFGNNLRDYLYSKEIEPLKKAIHYAMFFSDYSLGKELGHDLSFIDPIQDLQKRYLAVKHYFNKLGHFQQQSFEGGSECSLSKPWNDSTPICRIGGGQKRLAEIVKGGSQIGIGRHSLFVFEMCLICHSLCNSQDRSLFWLHNCLVCSFCATDDGICQCSGINLIYCFDLFCKSS